MKKSLLFCLLLAACAGTTGEGTGLVRLDKEPTNCEFLYNLNTSVTNYKITDAYDFVEKQILEQDGIGDTYYVYNEKTVENPDAIFGPKNTYKLKVKVYSCKK